MPDYFIDKDEPSPTCNRKCYLKQQLKEAQEIEKKVKGLGLHK